MGALNFGVDLNLRLGGTNENHSLISHLKLEARSFKAPKL